MPRKLHKNTGADCEDDADCEWESEPLHPRLQQNYTGADMTPRQNIVFWSFLTKTWKVFGHFLLRLERFERSRVEFMARKLCIHSN